MPTITQISPNNAGTGAGYITITVDGTNFVGPAYFGDDGLSGSEVQWKANGEVTTLPTTYVSPTQLTASVYDQLLESPANAAITVQQPSLSSSNALPFAVRTPTISTISPPGVPAGSGDTTLTVNGANFSTNDDDEPFILLNNIPLSTTFVDSGHLTAVIPAGFLFAPYITPTVTLASSQNPTVYHQSVTFTARVTSPTTGTPTGSVTFVDAGGTLASSVPLNGAGIATLTTSTLNAGSHSIRAIYLGDASFAANISAAVTQVVEESSVVMTVSVTPAVPLLGGTATYKVTLTGSSGPPDGSVVINDNSSDAPVEICSISSLTAGPSASTGACTVTYNNSDLAHSPGPHDLTVEFTAESGCCDTSTELSVDVATAASTAGTPTSSNGNVYDYGFATTFSSTVSPHPASPVYGGAVNFYDNGLLIATGTPDSSSGVATSPAILLDSGSHSITAQYSGDWHYATSALSAALPVTVNVSQAKPFIVQVWNPNGTNSNAVPFFVLPPGLVSLSTNSAPAGSPDLTLTLTGINYLPGTRVRFGPALLLPSAVTATTLTVVVPALALVTPGVYSVQAVNPGGTISNGLNFTVVGLGLTLLAPAAIPVGSASFTLTATGTNFAAGSQIVFNGTALPTSAINSGTLTATVPNTLFTAAGVVNVSVTNASGPPTSALPFTVLSPTLVSISPTSVSAGAAGFTLTVAGTNFVPGSQVRFDGSALPTVFSSANALTATVSNTLIGSPKVATISVANPGTSGNLTAGLPLAVISAAPLSIGTTSLPAGIAGASYTAVLTAKGGAPPYTWSAAGYPPALSMNAASGVLSGVLQIGGTFTVTVTVKDSSGASVSAPFSLAVGAPPVTISSSASLPNGTVGVSYLGFISASGGTEPYKFSIASGSLPDGLSFSTTGTISGTPKTPGRFQFAVEVTDAKGDSASSDTSITIQPAPLTLTAGAATPPAAVGTATSITFTPAGGVPPYRFTPCAAPPPGMSFSSGVLSGTPTTAGTFTVCLVLADSTGKTITKSSPLTIAEVPPPSKLTLGGTLANGKVGVAYTGQIVAAGGTGPFTYSGSGLPDGLTLSNTGAIGGTPTTAGQFTFSAGVTDSSGATASGTFSITIAAGDITIVTTSLPDGQIGVAYSVTLSASGGNGALTWTVSGLPDGLTATAAGVVAGIPKAAGKFSVTVSVQDSTVSTGERRTTLSLTILPAALVVNTATAPPGTVGSAYSLTIQVSGGTAPYTFSATGLPEGLTISGGGVIGGTPTAPGTSTVVVTVKDAAGITTTKTLTITLGLPSTPPLTYAGVPDTANPLQQPRLTVSLGSTFPVDVVVALTMTFKPDSGADDPAIQFSSGGRTAKITVPAGATTGATDIGVQTGTVAGLITITAQMQAAGQDVTPSPAPVRTIRIAPGAPVIVTGSVTAVRNATGFAVTLSGFVTDREITQAIFTFTPAAGSNLQTTTLTVNVDALFAAYFGSAGAAATGSQFTFTQPFTVTGSAQSIASVTVTLVNKIGQSAAVTATVN